MFKSRYPNILTNLFLNRSFSYLQYDETSWLLAASAQYLKLWPLRCDAAQASPSDTEQKWRQSNFFFFKQERIIMGYFVGSNTV